MAPKPMINVVLDYEIIDGQPLTFAAPCNCSEAGGLRVIHSGGTREFTFRDAHKNILHYTANVFAAGAYVKVILDFNSGSAYIQNADTNTYLETRFSMLRPLNLLDNSDFRNPVNQRGGDLYTAKGYSIDRWKTSYNGLEITVEDGYLELHSTVSSELRGVAQLIDLDKTPPAGTTLTVAYKLVGDGEGIFMGTCEMPASGYTDIANNIYNNFFVRITSANDQGCGTCGLVIRAGADVAVEWVALYEGEYSYETLPPYRSKGYGAEMLECQRYYQVRSTNAISAVDMRPAMRLRAPTIMQREDGNYAYSADL